MSGSGGRLNSRSSILPALVVALCLIAVTGAIQVVQVVRQVDLHFVTPMGLGFDYQDFYQASRQLGSGSPYDVQRYTTPPLPAFMNYPLSRLSFDLARQLMMFTTAASVVFSFGVMLRRFRPGGENVAVTLLVCGLITVLFSYPFLFLLDRGNIDGWVLALISLGLLLLGKNDLLAGLAWAFAIMMKVYPALLLLPALAYRRWKLLAGILLPCMVSIVLMPTLWAQFVQRLLQRTETFRITENASIANTFVGLAKLPHLVGVAVSRESAIALAMIAYAIMLGTLFLTDLRRFRCDSPSELELVAAASRYVPFMAAIPRVAYHYELVLLVPLIPVLCYLWEREVEWRARGALVMVTVGVALSQSQAVAAEQLLATILPHFVPGFGLLLAMVGSVVYSVVTLKRTAMNP